MAILSQLAGTNQPQTLAPHGEDRTPAAAEADGLADHDWCFSTDGREHQGVV